MQSEHSKRASARPDIAPETITKWDGSEENLALKYLDMCASILQICTLLHFRPCFDHEITRRWTREEEKSLMKSEYEKMGAKKAMKELY